VLAEAPGRPDQVWAVPFDATHDRQAGLSYLTIAVGRDYADIAPTSGTYRAPVGGRLTVTKRLELASVDWVTA
jgi:transglutaminase-like putative cysteine protease